MFIYRSYLNNLKNSMRSLKAFLFESDAQERDSKHLPPISAYSSRKWLIQSLSRQNLNARIL